MNQIVLEIFKSHGEDASGFAPSTNAPNVLHGVVRGANALKLWSSLRDRFAETGLWPIIRGDFEDVDAFEHDPQAALASIPRGSMRELLAPRLREELENLQQHLPGKFQHTTDLDAFARQVDASGIHSFSDTAEPEQPWPAAPDTTISIHSITDGVSQKPLKEVGFALIELKHPYEAPAYLGFGGWNAAPPPEEIAAALREWEAAYGAVPIAITGDVLECMVDRPPQTPEAAFHLAAEQYMFCDDIVGQGTQTVRQLAIGLWRSPTWFFWWD
jgi:hypothetical protein